MRSLCGERIAAMWLLSLDFSSIYLVSVCQWLRQYEPRSEDNNNNNNNDDVEGSYLSIQKCPAIFLLPVIVLSLEPALPLLIGIPISCFVS